MVLGGFWAVLGSVAAALSTTPPGMVDRSTFFTAVGIACLVGGAPSWAGGRAQRAIAIVGGVLGLAGVVSWFLSSTHWAPVLFGGMAVCGLLLLLLALRPSAR